jgi:hypothetical protein
MVVAIVAVPTLLAGHRKSGDIVGPKDNPIDYDNPYFGFRGDPFEKRRGSGS